MLARLIPKSSQFHRCLTLISSRAHFSSTNFAAPIPSTPKPHRFFSPQPPHFRFFSTEGNNGDDDSPASTTDFWKISSEGGEDIDSLFSVDPVNAPGVDDRGGDGMKGEGFGGGDWNGTDAGGGDIFAEAEGFGGGDEEGAAEDYTPWSFGAEEKEEQEVDLFGGVEEGAEVMGFQVEEKSLEEKQLEAEKALTSFLKGSSVYSTSIHHFEPYTEGFSVPASSTYTAVEGSNRNLSLSRCYSRTISRSRFTHYSRKFVGRMERVGGRRVHGQ